MRSGLRWVVAGLLGLTALGLATRWVDTTHLRVPVLQSVFPVLGVLAVLLLIGCIALRDVRFVVAAALVTIAPVVLGIRSLIPDTVAAGARDEVVMVSNLQYGQADPRAIVREVRDRHVTALVLVEVTPDAAARLRQAGLDAALPHQVGAPRPGADGTVIRSAHPLSERESVHVPRRFDQPVATVHAPEGDYVLRAAHPYPPIPDLVRSWRRQLDELATWRAAQPADVPLVIAGDFNASSSHPGFRALARTMHDAHGSTGAGWVRTWPHEGRTPAFVQIDHVLVRGMGVVDAGVTTVPRTDHAAVWARLRVG
ncbi:endonuclease/exonuclease/phosphatase family protein [Luteipulveratus halotolerans]|uniref:endonuclease/exonuclease/phosphatase family protein n=1 Tax=Luteipulveratus halotolerans TaxID=1631356 RepID=UPI0012F92074|nr:endonuclease/exonuclease/phosphatase family protein [Luteipulveratus halotolerans]